MPTTTLAAVKVRDKSTRGHEQLKALLREKLGLRADATVNLLVVTWSRTPRWIGKDEYHDNVTVEYSL